MNHVSVSPTKGNGPTQREKLCPGWEMKSSKALARTRVVSAWWFLYGYCLLPYNERSVWPGHFHKVNVKLALNSYDVSLAVDS